MTPLASPARVVARFAEAGIRLSERALKDRAKVLGVGRRIGKALFFTEADIQAIIHAAAVAAPASPPAENKPCHSKSAAASGTTLSLSTAADIAARAEHLTRSSQKPLKPASSMSASVLPFSAKHQS